MYKETRLREGNPNWKGGVVMTPNGYVAVLCPEYPGPHYAGCYVLEHRMIMEQYLGRALETREQIHHINEIKTDNRIENLQLCTGRTHRRRFHRKSNNGN